MSGNDSQPVHGYPMAPTVHGPRAQEGGGDKKAGSSSLTPVLLAAIAIVVVIVAGGILLAVWFFGQLESSAEDETYEFETEVIVAEDGHFRHTLMEDWGDTATVNISVQSLSGDNCDIYIMDEDQYESAYGNATTGSFSAIYKWENLTSMEEVIVFQSTRPFLYLVVDNTDNPLTPSDAVPDGTITVALRVVTTYHWEAVF